MRPSLPLDRIGFDGVFRPLLKYKVPRLRNNRIRGRKVARLAAVIERPISTLLQIAISVVASRNSRRVRMVLIEFYSRSGAHTEKVCGVTEIFDIWHPYNRS